MLSARIDKLPDGPEIGAVKADIVALSRLVGQLLSAAQADTLVVNPESRFDLAAIAEAVVGGYGTTLAIQQGRKLALEAPASCPVKGDADAVAHALRNLIENALRFSPRGEEVLVQVFPTGEIAVLDRGPGIPDDRKPLVVKRFWRANAADLGGTGLGLAIVARIAQAHGTALGIRDREGGGTSFSLALAPA